MKINLIPGDTLFLYTDGVTEAFNKKDELYGDKRFEDLQSANLMASHKEIVKITLDDIAAFASGKAQSDDITLMAIRYFGR
jgi:sigma-B regulation protein RsbU (phosphoserine phosphatase)